MSARAPHLLALALLAAGSLLASAQLAKCPPTGFDSVKNLNMTAYMSKTWFVHMQVCVRERVRRARVAGARARAVRVQSRGDVERLLAEHGRAGWLARAEGARLPSSDPSLSHPARPLPATRKHRRPTRTKRSTSSTASSEFGVARAQRA